MPAEGIGRVTAAAKAPSNGSGAGPSTEPAAADGTATPLPLLTRYSLRLMTFVVDAVPVVPPRSTSPDVAALEQKSASCRLLLSLFVLDAINWVCYKLFQARAAARAAPPAPRAAAHATLPPPSHSAAARRSF